MPVINLERDYTDTATIGKMYMPSGTVFDTIELPWNDNIPSVSCIPEGVYKLDKRQDASSRYEVANVKGRTYIMIHVANFEGCGCIGIGEDLGVVNNDWAILRSSESFDKFMLEMETCESWSLSIQERITTTGYST